MILSNKSFVIFIILSLSIAPAIFLGEGNRNLLLIVVMFIAPIFLLKYLKIDKIDILLLALFLYMIVVPMVYNPESYRISTVLYSVLFGLLFLSYKQLFYNSTFTVEFYSKLLKYIIYAYFITLLIQQFCVLTGLPVFNVSNYDPTEPWKLNSLSPEPSHTARIVALLMFSYIITIEIIKKRTYSFVQEFKIDKYIWLAFLWIMLTTNSGTAFLFLILIFFKFIQLKNIIFLIFISLVSIFLLEYLNITAFERTLNFSQAVLTLDIKTMMRVDHSASLRVAPIIVLFDQIDLTSMNTWFGHGIDSTSNILSKYIVGVNEDFSGGGSLYLIYEYGLFSWILFMIFTFVTIVKIKEPITFAFWFFLVFMYSINSQIVWLCMILMFTNKCFYNQYNKGIN